ncbi:hypothetical protein JOB18_045798, partial [Solea senegalensis]
VASGFRENSSCVEGYERNIYLLLLLFVDRSCCCRVNLKLQIAFLFLFIITTVYPLFLSLTLSPFMFSHVHMNQTANWKHDAPVQMSHACVLTDSSGHMTSSPLGSPTSHRGIHPSLLSPTSMGPSGSLHSPLSSLGSPMNGMSSPFSVISSPMGPHSINSPGMGYGSSVSPQVKDRRCLNVTLMMKVKGHKSLNDFDDEAVKLGQLFNDLMMKVKDHRCLNDFDDEGERSSLFKMYLDDEDDEGERSKVKGRRCLNDVKGFAGFDLEAESVDLDASFNLRRCKCSGSWKRLDSGFGKAENIQLKKGVNVLREMKNAAFKTSGDADDVMWHFDFCRLETHTHTLCSMMDLTVCDIMVVQL